MLSPRNSVAKMYQNYSLSHQSFATPKASKNEDRFFVANIRIYAPNHYTPSSTLKAAKDDQISGLLHEPKIISINELRL